MAAPIVIAAVAAVAIHPATAPDFWAAAAKATGLIVKIVQASTQAASDVAMLPAGVMFAPGYRHPHRRHR